MHACKDKTFIHETQKQPPRVDQNLSKFDSWCGRKYPLAIQIEIEAIKLR